MATLPPQPAQIPDDSRLQRLGGYLQADPDNAPLLRDYAAEALRVREHRAAALAIERLAQHGETTLDDELLRARAWRLDGQVAQALAALDQAGVRWPGEGHVALERAATHFGQQALDAALEALPDAGAEAALPVPLAAEVRAMRVRLLHHLGRIDDAQAEAFRDGPALSAAVARAVLPVLMDASRLDDAQALAGTLLQASGDTPAPYEVCEPLAAAALDRDDVEAARRWSAHGLQLRQDDGRIWLLHGLAELRAGAQDPALAALGRAATLMPAHAGSQLALGWAHLAHNDLAAAQAAFEEAREISPSFAECHGSLAVVAALRGQVQPAQELIRTSQRLDRHTASAMWAQQLLEGTPDLAQVERIARLVIARVRDQRPTPASRPS